MTLPNYLTLLKPSQQSFLFSPLLLSFLSLLLALPLSLAPYFLLPSPPPPNILDVLPVSDGWVVVARLSGVATALAGIPMVFLPTRDILLRAFLASVNLKQATFDPKGSNRHLFLGGTLAGWAAVVALAGIPGEWIGGKVVLVGVLGSFLLSFLIPGESSFVRWVSTDANPCGVGCSGAVCDSVSPPPSILHHPPLRQDVNISFSVVVFGRTIESDVSLAINRDDGQPARGRVACS